MYNISKYIYLGYFTSSETTFCITHYCKDSLNALYYTQVTEYFTIMLLSLRKFQAPVYTVEILAINYVENVSHHLRYAIKLNSIASIHSSKEY